MQKLASAFAALDPARRLLVAVATIGAFAAVLAIARGAGTPAMALLYSGLEPAAAGEVVASLEQMGEPYEVRGNAILVDAVRRDSLRMALAAEGKPATGTAGYEILDNLSGFGTTAQMFDAAYWRAKEGELARTILANPNIRAARVHISNPAQRPFSREVPASASVVVTVASGGLPARQAKALKFLVASAVQGLAPDAVTVIDSEGGLIRAADEPGLASQDSGDRAALLRANVERLLEARVGAGRAIVEVNVDTVTESEQITERVFDPDSRVAISTVTEETTSQAQDAREGAVTVAGNLPDGDAGGRGADSSSQESGTREQVNYEVSETQREVTRAPGAVRRLSVAVLVDGLRAAGADGSATWTPRGEAELADLRELVASAVGFDPERGDVITIRSMEFPPVEVAGTEVVQSGFVQRIGVDAMRAVQIAVLAAVALILGLFVVRPVLLGAGQQALPPPPRDLPAPATPEGHGTALDGEIDDGFLPQMAVVDDHLGALRDPEAASPGARLRQITDGRASEAASVLHGWMEDREARA